MRKELLELIEKETSYKSRMAQIDEDMRPENIERALSGVGTTRTAELRDVRRRVLENERRGLDSLLNLTTQSRIRLEEDVRQADSLVSKLRQRLLPLIDKEIEKKGSATFRSPSIAFWYTARHSPIVIRAWDSASLDLASQDGIHCRTRK